MLKVSQLGRIAVVAAVGVGVDGDFAVAAVLAIIVVGLVSLVLKSTWILFSRNFDFGCACFFECVVVLFCFCFGSLFFSVCASFHFFGFMRLSCCAFALAPLLSRLARCIACLPNLELATGQNNQHCACRIPHTDKK